MGKDVYCSMARLHLACAGVCFSSSPTPLLGHAHMCLLFSLRGTEVKMPHINAIIVVSIFYTDFKLILSLISKYYHTVELTGGMPCTNTKFQFQFQFLSMNSKPNFKLNFKIQICNCSVLILIFVYTTDDVCLTPLASVWISSKNV